MDKTIRAAARSWLRLRTDTPVAYLCSDKDWWVEAVPDRQWLHWLLFHLLINSYEQRIGHVGSETWWSWVRKRWEMPGQQFLHNLLMGGTYWKWRCTRVLICGSSNRRGSFQELNLRGIQVQRGLKHLLVIISWKGFMYGQSGRGQQRMGLSPRDIQPLLAYHSGFTQVLWLISKRNLVLIEDSSVTLVYLNEYPSVSLQWAPGRVGLGLGTSGASRFLSMQFTFSLTVITDNLQ